MAAPLPSGPAFLRFGLYISSPAWYNVKTAFWSGGRAVGHSFFAYIFRMRHIARWALMRNTRTENVEEHSYEAAVLSHALAVIGRDVFGKALDPDKIAVAALFHDASEIITGDMPTPVKYHDPSLQSAYKRVEAAAQDKLMSMLPPEFRKAAEQTMAALKAMEMEELDYFMERFLPAFSLTLDELQ